VKNTNYVIQVQSVIHPEEWCFEADIADRRRAMRELKVWRRSNPHLTFRLVKETREVIA